MLFDLQSYSQKHIKSRKKYVQKMYDASFKSYFNTNDSIRGKYQSFFSFKLVLLTN